VTVSAAGSPALRFPQFSGDWAARRGGDAFGQRRERGEDGLPLYSVTIERGIVRRDSLDREFASAMADEGNLRVRKDDLAYNMMRMWQGAVGRAPEDGMVSPAYVVLKPKAHTAPAFFENWFKRSRSLYLLGAYSHGLTKDRLRLYFSDFAIVPMTLPDREEQQKIADFLGAVDERIGLLTRKAEALARYKREVARRLFTRELRFRRDDGSDFPDWEAKQLGRVAVINPRSGPLPEKFEYIDLESVTNGQLAATQTILREDAPERAQRVVQDGDILFQTVRPSQMNNLFFEHGENFVASTGYAQIRTKADARFLFQMLLTQSFVAEVIRRCTGTSYPAINTSDLAAIEIRIPHPDEQRRIADFLSALDAKINTVRSKVTAMQTFKKGLLQQMFV
jgi:type I restriction enzyme, S subunit